jgi:uncharacterized protein (DUF488 family)
MIASNSTSSSPPRSQTVYTIGHSTHPIADFINILEAHQIKMLVDVRRFSASRHNPQFGEDELRSTLQEHGIGYLHLEGLGGRRKTSKESVNTGWKNLSFRGYADYMQTDEFREAFERLVSVASIKNTTIMCAEALPWRCHRSLIGDMLLLSGFVVEDILSLTTSRPHQMTPWAKVRDGIVIYPGDEETSKQE